MKIITLFVSDRIPRSAEQIEIAVRKNRRFRENCVRRIVVTEDEIVDGKIKYFGRWLKIELGFGNDKCGSIFLNQAKESFGVCNTCKAPDGIKSIMSTNCPMCKQRAGKCRICKRNRLDCCC
jgi:hypothetical protein